MDTYSGPKDDHTKKRPPKGFRACWECEKTICKTEQVYSQTNLTLFKARDENYKVTLRLKPTQPVLAA